MQKVSFKEYVEAKNDIIFGKEYKEFSHLTEDGTYKVYGCEDGHNFYEQAHGHVIEFWSTKYPTSRYFLDFNPKVAVIKKEIAGLKQRITELENELAEELKIGSGYE